MYYIILLYIEKDTNNRYLQEIPNDDIVKGIMHTLIYT